MVAIMQNEREREGMLKQKRSVFVLSLYGNLCGVLVWKKISLFLIFQKKKQLVIFANEILIHLKLAFFLLGRKKRGCIM